MKKVLLKGPLMVNSGYGVHARQIARWLFEHEDKGNVEVYTELTRWGDCAWNVDLGKPGNFNRRILQSSKKSLPFYDVAISVRLPNEWEPFRAKLNVGVTAAVEADRCPAAWIEACDQMQLVIVPSKFAAESLRSVNGRGEVTKPKTKVVVVPESFPDEILDESIKPLDIGLPSEHNLLVVGQFTGQNPENDRKNLPYTLKWFIEAFGGRKDVGLVLKTGFARQGNIDRILTTNVLKKFIFEIAANNEIPNIHLIHGNLSDREMVGLYRHPKIKALVNLGHGEGFGLPLLEAAASGLPTIATNWSAHTEFLTPRTKNDSWLGVRSTLAPVHQTRVDSIFEPISQWAYPDEGHAKQRMVEFISNGSLPRKWAKNHMETIRKEYSFDSISREWDKAINLTTEE